MATTTTRRDFARKCPRHRCRQGQGGGTGHNSNSRIWWPTETNSAGVDVSGQHQQSLREENGQQPVGGGGGGQRAHKAEVDNTCLCLSAPRSSRYSTNGSDISEVRGAESGTLFDCGSNAGGRHHTKNGNITRPTVRQARSSAGDPKGKRTHHYHLCGAPEV